jgi:hypothetical protein
LPQFKAWKEGDANDPRLSNLAEVGKGEYFFKHAMYGYAYKFNLWLTPPSFAVKAEPPVGETMQVFVGLVVQQQPYGHKNTIFSSLRRGSVALCSAHDNTSTHVTVVTVRICTGSALNGARLEAFHAKDKTEALRTGILSQCRPR